MKRAKNGCRSRTSGAALAGGAVLVALLAAASGARAEAAPPLSFALIIGVNQSPEPDLQPLRYADDDAARYRDLFRTLGARTFLLATLDANTQRLHPEAAAEAAPARTEQLGRAVDALASEVDQARKSGRATVLYVFYAGHGGDDGQTGYLTLEDGRLTGPDLLQVVFDRVNADRSHLVVDACSAYLLVLGRGRGGQRRPLQGFTHVAGALMDRTDIGLLLSTSSARESHEWAAFQAGVFSHEVRSGIFGAADANADGAIDYPEMAAFIQRANESIANERYRPEVFWRAPRGSDALVEIRSALARRVEIPASESGHYYLEDPRGVRLADFHNGKRMSVRMLRPQTSTHLYLERPRDGREYLLPGAVDVLDAAALTAEEAHVGVRSAAHEAFQLLFALPFDGVGTGEATAIAVAAEPRRPAGEAKPAWSARRIVGWSLIATSAIAAAASAELIVSARSTESGPARTPGAVMEREQRTRSYERGAYVAAGLAGSAALAGAAVLLWPEATPVRATASANVVMVDWVGRF